MWTRTRSNVSLVVALMVAVAPIARAQGPAVVKTEDEPDLAQYRERFKQGLERYDANDVAGALSFWEPLYRDLGPTRGYRVGYNLARAYEVFGDATRAAERYESFLDEVRVRRQDKQPIDADVETDELKATARMDDLQRTRGRIHVAATTPPASVRIDKSEPRLAGFVAYVSAGAHDVVFQPGSTDEHVLHVEVQAGQVIEVAAPSPKKKEPTPVLRDTTTHPIAPVWLWVSGATTVLVGGGLTATAYANAVVLHDRSQPSPTTKEVTDYNGARTLAYVSWAAPATLAVLTAILLTWYVTGAKHLKVPIATAIAF